MKDWEVQAALYAQANRELERRMFDPGPAVLQLIEDDWAAWMVDADWGANMRGIGPEPAWTLPRYWNTRAVAGRHPNHNPPITYVGWKL